MCVLMSATAPNSCKLAVYEGEVPRKSTTFFDFHTIWGGKKVKEGSDHSDVAQCENTLEGFGPGMCKVWPGDSEQNSKGNVQSISYNSEYKILRTQGQLKHSLYII